MSRIIKEGTLKEQTKVCPRCGCVFGYDVRDVWKEFDDSPCSHDLYYIKCPYCKDSIKLSLPELTKLDGNSDFVEDAKALAEQYGFDLISIEVNERGKHKE